MLAAQNKPLAAQRRGAQAAPRRLVRARAVPQQVQQAPSASAATRPLRVMISGAPASGKGTQAARIVDKVG